MRRVVPWSLLGVLTVGVALGAGIGTAGQPSALSAREQIARIIAATKSARSARFTYASVTTSSNPLFRSRGSGTGEVNFTTDSMRTSERQRSTGFVGTGDAPARATTQTSVITQIQIGRTSYMQLSTAIHVVGARWIKGATFPAGSFGALGVFGEIGPLGSLTMNESVKGLRVQNLGAATIEGRATTKLLVSLPTCMAVSKGRGLRTVLAPTELWVDGRDRLVQATEATREDVSKDAFSGTAFSGTAFAGHSPTGRSTIVETVRLSDFGTAVTITAPQVMPVGSSSGSAFLELRRKGCSS